MCVCVYIYIYIYIFHEVHRHQQLLDVSSGGWLLLWSLSLVTELVFYIPLLRNNNDCQLYSILLVILVYFSLPQNVDLACPVRFDAR